MGATVSSNVSSSGMTYSHSLDESTILMSNARGLAMLQRAKQRLDHLDFVGLTSRFDESMEVLAWKLGIPSKRYCACNVNLLKSFAAHDTNAILSDDARRAVLEDNALDVELYAHAVQLFQADLAAMRSATKISNDNDAFGCLKSFATCKEPKNRTNYRGRAKTKKSIGVASYFKEHEVEIRSGKLKSRCSYECARGVNSSSNLFIEAPSLGDA